jgi:hypothetical protein
MEGGIPARRLKLLWSGTSLCDKMKLALIIAKRGVGA